MPTKQLDIIFGIRRRTNGSESPFADLDHLYLEILVRQPDQDFLKTFLNLLCLPAEHSVGVELIRILLNMKREEFLAKIRGLHSLLDIFDVPSRIIEVRLYHTSFLEFLRDEERSCHYHFDEALTSRKFVDLFLEAVIKYVSNIQQSRHVLCIHEAVRQ